MDIKVGELRIDPRGQVWRVVDKKNGIMRIHPVDKERSDQRCGKVIHQTALINWPIVQIQPVPEVPLPCPFCGAEPKVFNYGNSSAIGCGCGVGVNGMANREAAISWWNTRAEPTKPKNQPEGIRWKYDLATRTLVAYSEDKDEPERLYGCFLRPNNCESNPMVAIDQVLRQLNAK